MLAVLICVWQSRFNLHFPEDRGYGASFPLLVCHLEIIFSEMAVHGFGLFFNPVAHFLIVEY